MIFKHEDQIGNQPVITLSNEGKTVLFSVLPHQGAALFDLHLMHNGKSRKIFRTWKKPDNFLDEYQTRFSGSQLFPFPNRLAKGSYIINGREYTFPLNDFERPNALHGHLFDKQFDVVVWDTDKRKLVLQYNYDGSDESYPFAYNITNEFTLNANQLVVTTIIKNLASSKMPFGYGWHPYFYSDNKINNWKVNLGASACMEIDSTMIPTGHIHTTSDFHSTTILGGRDLDTCFISPAHEVLLYPDDLKGYISLGTKDFEYLQVYLPNERNCIAIEPQTCAPNAFNNKLGYRELDIGEECILSFDIKLVVHPNS